MNVLRLSHLTDGSHPLPGTRARIRRVPILLATTVLAWSALALVCFSATYVTSRISGSPLPLGRTFARSVLYAYVWIPVSLGTVLLTRHFPLTRERILSRGLIHLVGAALLILGRMAIFHRVGLSLDLLRPETSFRLALAAYMVDSLITYLLVAGVAHAFLYARTLRARELAREQMESQLVRAELQALKMQLHPHFLFNTLHAITALVHLDPNRAEHVIASLSELLRQALAHRESQEVSLQDEVASLTPYLDIERTRLGDRLAIEMCLDPQVLSACVPHLLLQPLVENAVRHGIAARRDGGRVQIVAERKGGKLCLVISDNGAGISGPPREGGVGLANTRARLERLYGDQHSFRFDSSPAEGTSIRIDLPYRRLAFTTAPKP